MTCIVGLVDQGKVYIGGDSAAVDGADQLTIRVDEKVFAKNGMVFGFSWSYRMGQLLRYRLTIPTHFIDAPVENYMIGEFIEAVRRCFKEGGYARKENEEEKAGQFLVGYKGRLFCVESDYQVAESVDGFMAIGSGGDIALGALWATRKFQFQKDELGTRKIRENPESRIIDALEAAERFNAGVRRPFTIIVSDGEAALDPR